MNGSIFTHLIKTIIYRYSIATKSANQNFGTATIGKGVRTPNELIHHMSDVLIASLNVCKTGNWEREKLEVGDFEAENLLFLTTCFQLLDYAESSSISEAVQLKLAQGPLSDVLTHIGQLSMISRLVGTPVAGQNYSRVDIDHYIQGLKP